MHLEHVQGCINICADLLCQSLSKDAVDDTDVEDLNNNMIQIDAINYNHYPADCCESCTMSDADDKMPALNTESFKTEFKKKGKMKSLHRIYKSS